MIYLLTIYRLLFACWTLCIAPLRQERSHGSNKKRSTRRERKTFPIWEEISWGEKSCRTEDIQI